MVELLYDVLENTSIAISIVPLVILIVRWKRAKALSAWLFLTLLIIDLLTELSTLILAWNQINNLFIWHIHAIFFSILLLLIYRTYLRSNISSFTLLIPNIIVCISGLLEAFLNQGYLRANTITYLMLCSQAILYSLLLFSSLINDRQMKDLTRSSEFWINAGMLFSFGTTMCLTLFENYIFEINTELMYYTWSIQLVANIIFHLVLARGIWLMRRT